jgi:alpha-tubulin suppressor-like RCC1 family protein
MSMRRRWGTLSRWLGVLLLWVATPAAAEDVAWGTPVKGLQYGLAIVPGTGALPSELQLEVQLRNTSSVKQVLPVEACSLVTWLSFTVLHVRVGNRVFRYTIGGLVDTADVHPHGPVELAPGEVLRERIPLGDILESPEMSERDSVLGTLLLEPREVELWVEFSGRVGRSRLASGRLMHRFGSVSTVRPGAAGGCVTQLVVSGATACALVRDGTPFCWGTYPPGVTSEDEDAEVAQPRPLRMLAGVVEIGLSGAVLCGRSPEGKVYCAGGNLAGTQGALSTTAQPIRVKELDGAVSLVTSPGELCARLADGTLACWGLMRPSLDASPPKLTATRWEQLSPGPSTVGLGSLHGCAVRKDGTLWCWGNNQQGQLGTGNNEPQAMPVQLSHLAQQVVSVAVSASHDCAALSDGSVWCWGSSEYGALGMGPVHSSLVPARVPGLSDVVRVAAGYQKTCAWKKDGSVWCFGELLRDKGAQALAKVPVEMKELGTRVEEIVFGFRHTCARTASQAGTNGGDVLCWGENTLGQLGNEDPVYTSPAVPVASLKGKALALAAGDYFTCALTTDGTVWCWGRGPGDQMGKRRGEEDASNRPVRAKLLCSRKHGTARPE